MLALATGTLIALAVLGIALVAGVVVALVLSGRVAEETQQLADEAVLFGRARAPLAQVRDELRSLADSVQRLRDR